MLEGVLAWFINNYIGEYFDNVNTHQLSIAYGEGEVELENLPLRVESFRKLNLPFDVKSGFVARLRLTLRLRSEGCLVNIDELFIVCGPRSDFDFDETREEEREQEVKQRLLEALESKWKFETLSSQESSSYYPSYSSFLSFSTSLFTNFTENLQIRVRDVHLRYEDDSIDPASPLVVGLQVRNLSIQSADESWNPTFISSTSSDITRKLVDLENFNVYWDTGSHVTLVKDLGRDILIDVMRDMMGPDKKGIHDYLIDPVNGKAFISRNSSTDALRSKSTPRISVDFNFDNISLSLNVLQYEQLLTVVDEFSRRQIILKNCRWRPRAPISKETARDWWNYAIHVNLREQRSQNEKNNWQFVLNRCSLIKRYFDVYLAILAQPEFVTRDMRATKDEIESELSFEEIQILRELVYDRFKKIQPKELSEMSSSTLGWTYLQSWLPSWFSSASEQSPQETDNQNSSFSSNFLEEDLIDVINSAADDSLLTRDTIFAQFNFSLEKASAVLIADPRHLTPTRRLHGLSSMKHIMEFELTKPYLTIETLPRTSSQRFKAKFSELTLQDKVSTSFGCLISPQPNSTHEPSGQLFELVYEKVWSSNLITNRLYVKTEPLRIVYNKSAFDLLYKFFSSKSYNNREKSSLFTQITRNRYESFKNQTKDAVQHAVEDLLSAAESRVSHVWEKWEFDLNVSAPQIVLPCGDNTDQLVIFDMGRLVFRNKILSHLRICQSEENDVFVTPPSTPPSNVDTRESSVESNGSTFSFHSLYQKYTVEVNDVQLLVGPTEDNWNFYLQKGCGPLHVFNRFSLTFDFQKRVTSASPDLPRVIISGNLPQLFMFLNESKIQSLQSCMSLLTPDKYSQSLNQPTSSVNEPSVKSPTTISYNKKIFFLVELTIKTFSVALQSRGQNLVELQVFGVTGKVEKSKGCQSIYLMVASLLMIDAHQKFGPEYEVLVASHKHLLLDSSKGSLVNKEQRVRSYSTAVSSITSGQPEREHLISLKVVSDSQNRKETVEVVFNNFDVIANQETLVELVAFFKRVTPAGSFNQSEGRASSNPSPVPVAQNAMDTTTITRIRSVTSRHAEVKIDFRQLNILLLRSIKMNTPGDTKDKKVATATFSGASILVKWGSEAIIEGFLKTMQVIGTGTLGEILKIGPQSEHSGKGPHGHSQPKGISFTIKRTFSENMLDLNLSLNSLYYFHSPSLLRELSSCAEEFKTYMSQLAEAVKSAAAEVAMELVSNPGGKTIHLEKKTRKSSQSYVKELRVQCSVENPLIELPSTHSFIRGLKKMIYGPPKGSRPPTDRLTLFECLAIGMDVIDGSVRIVDDVKPTVHLLEANVKQLFLFHSTNGASDHKGNMKSSISIDYFNQNKGGWEPLVEHWGFVLRWDIKKDKIGKDGIMHRMSGNTEQASIFLVSEDTLNFNVTNTTLDMYYDLKDKWDAEVIEDDGVLDVAALMNSPSKFLSRVKSSSGPNSTETKIIMELSAIGFSFVNHLNEELVYLTLRRILMEYAMRDAKHSFNCTVRDLQVDNQLRSHQKEVVVHQMPLEEGDPMIGQPALHISFQRTIVPHIHFFPEFQVKCKDVILNLEELLLLKLYEFFGYPWEGIRAIDRAIGHLATNAFASAGSRSSSFIYVILFEIVLKQIRLSVYTTSHLPNELVRLKERLQLTLISFEDAKVQLESFRRETSLNTINYLWTEIVTHYKKQLSRQAAKILGSVDFLGNPLGLMSDVSEGITDLIVEGNVGGLVTNITHGISNSTAKFMSSLSNSLEVTTVDARHQEIRRRIQQDNRDHLRTGIRGLGVGLMGGVTSIVTQTFDGVKSDGLEGLVSGFGKGLLGTVTKPAVGMLDFATGAASAVRETIRKVSRHSYQGRYRPPRVCIGPNGLLPPFDMEQALGQQFFYSSSYITDRESHEVFESFHVLSSSNACIISSERIRILYWDFSSKMHGQVVMTLHLKDFRKCQTERKPLGVGMDVSYLVILFQESIDLPDDMMGTSEYPSFGPTSKEAIPSKRMAAQRLQCSSDTIALRLMQVLNLSKSAFDRRMTSCDNRGLSYSSSSNAVHWV